MTQTRKRPPRLPNQLSLALALALLLPTGGNALEPGSAALPGVAAESLSQRDARFTLEQLGLGYALKLRGTQSRSGVNFNIRQDEVPLSASLTLHYSFSPSLIGELSHINVLVNDELAASIPLTEASRSGNMTREVQIPVKYLGEFNRLDLQLVAHYTDGCENPVHSSLWANISNKSSLALTLATVPTEPDLAKLPQPFFDNRDPRQMVLPFVLPEAPDNITLEAAGVVSSWMGALAGYRGARFPVSGRKFPSKGHAVIFVVPGKQPEGLPLAEISGPTLALRTNPLDAAGRFLMVMGRNPAELRIAAAALATGYKKMGGDTLRIEGFKLPEARKPYDAPNWLRSDRPVQIGELSAARDLNVSGFSPDIINVGFRMPPDLFAWGDRGVPVRLRYRYTPRPQPDGSTLNIGVNREFISSTTLRAIVAPGNDAASRVLEAMLPERASHGEHEFRVPLYKLPPRSQMQFHFKYAYTASGDCQTRQVDNVNGAVEPDSTIDISGYPHFMEMPDLAAFRDAGFPFTRLADLAATAVIMPNAPDDRDTQAYLDLMGRMGGSTGFPALRVVVANADAVDRYRDRDLLVLGSRKNQPLAERWGSKVGAEALPGDNGAVGLLAGFESPLAAGRSVVLVSGAGSNVVADLVDTMTDDRRATKITGSVVSFRGGQFESVSAEKTYEIGELPVITRMHWWLSQRPLALLLVMALGILWSGLLISRHLRERVRQRLSK